MTPGSPLRVGLIGCGVVGGGVAEALLDANRPWESDGIRLELAAAADVRWPKDCVIPKRLRTGDAQAVLRDPTIDVVVELVGGTTFAYTLIEGALRAGKDVVTANKALLAERGAPLFRLAAAKGREIAFEAAVAGGIPILEAIRSGLAANNITTVYGILNGTTNFILSRMSDTGASFDDALAEAQQLGFAEADPTLDVEGIDAGHKLSLLAALAFGFAVPMKRIPIRGIRRVDPLDIAYAGELGCRIKLLAVARLIPAGLEIHVAPTLIPESHPLAKVENEVNGIFVDADRVGKTLFVGRGAGRYPTASAVLSDLIRLARGASPGYVRRMNSAKRLKPVTPEEHRARYYMRLSAEEKPGVLAAVTSILGRAGISIASVVQLGRPDPSAPVPVALLTHETTEARIQKAVGRINRLEVSRARTVVYPFVE